MTFLKSAIFTVFLLASPWAQADFGNWFVANQRLSTPLDTSDKKLSFRFTCQDNMSLTAVAVYCAQASNPPAYQISLQSDERGSPSGEPLAFSSYIPRSQSWTTVPLESVPLLKDKVYHLVLEQDVKRGGDHAVGVIGPSNWASFLSTDVLNHLHPNDGSPDPAANTMLFEDNHWRELDEEPVYAVYGAGEQFQGNPYDDPGIRPVYGSGDGGDKSHQVLQGEALHFHCGFQATSFVLRVRRQGNPTAPLNYLILKNEFQIHETFPVHSGVALAPAQAGTSFQWVTVGFDDPRTSNFSPECWFLVFQTDSGRPSKSAPGCEDCYLLSDVGNSGGLAEAANMTFDGGPHLSREVYSTDGGSAYKWMDEFERDGNVGALGPPCHIVPFGDPQQLIPTPMPLDGAKGFGQ
jgi:hypothetical protein